jgi:SHS2 domain-containing protein
MLFSKFRVDIDERTMVLKATCWGEKLDAKKHDMRGEVKAVTYHKMEIRKEGEYYRVQVIFDV